MRYRLKDFEKVLHLIQVFFQRCLVSNSYIHDPAVLSPAILNKPAFSLELIKEERGQRRVVLTIFDFSLGGSRDGRLAHLNVWSAPRGPVGTHKGTNDGDVHTPHSSWCRYSRSRGVCGRACYRALFYAQHL